MQKVIVTKEVAAIILGLALAVVGYLIGSAQTPVAHGAAMCELGSGVLSYDEASDDVYVAGCSAIY